MGTFEPKKGETERKRFNSVATSVSMSSRVYLLHNLKLDPGSLAPDFQVYHKLEAVIKHFIQTSKQTSALESILDNDESDESINTLVDLDDIDVHYFEPLPPVERPTQKSGSQRYAKKKLVAFSDTLDRPLVYYGSSPAIRHAPTLRRSASTESFEVFYSCFESLEVVESPTVKSTGARRRWWGWAASR